MAKRQPQTLAVHITARLQAKLDNLIHYPCTMLLAPVGFGKTVCMRHYLCKKAADAAEELTVFWQNVQGDTFVGLEELIQVLEPIGSDFCQYLRESGIPTDAQGRREFSRKVGVLQQGLEQETVIVADLGASCLDEDALRFFELLVMQLPMQMHLVVLSRFSLLPWDSAPFFYNRINLITWEDMRFTPDDVGQYYLDCGISIPPKSIQQVAKLCEGWGALIRYNMLEYIDKRHMISAQKAASLIQKMVYDPLPKAQKNILLQLSVFDSFTGPQIRFLCDDEDALVFAERICAQGLFLAQGEDTQSYLFEGCFASCVRAQWEQLPREEQNRMLSRAGDWFMAAGKRYMNARAYYARAGNFDALMQAVQMRRFLRPYAKDEQDFLAYYTICPSEVRRRYPQALLVFAKYLFTSNKLELAEQVCGEFQQAISDNRDLSPQDVARYKASYQMLLVYEQYNNLEKMLHHLEEAEALAASASGVVFWPETGLNDTPSILSLYHRERGALRREVELYTAYNAKYAQMTGSYNGAELVMQAEACYLTGDLADSEIAIYQVQFITDRDKQKGVWFAVLYLQIRIEMLKGNWNHVQSLFESIRRLPPERLVDMLLSPVQLCEAYVYCKLRQPRLLEGMFPNGWDTELNVYFRALPAIYALHAEVLLVRGDYVAVVALHKKYLDAARVYPNLLPEIMLELTVAAAYQALGESVQAISHFEHALAAAEPDGLVAPFIEMGEYIEPMLDGVPGHSGFLAQILGRARLFSQRMEQIRKEHFTMAQSGLTPQEIKIAQMVSDRLSNKEIADLMFISESTVKTHLTHIFSKLNIKKRSELKGVFKNR